MRHAQKKRSPIPVSEQHLAELRQSGLTLKTIRKAGFRSITPDEAARFMGWSKAACDDDYLLLPCRNTNGGLRYRVKPPVAISRDPDKKGAKYLTRQHAASFVCCTPGVADSELLVITEGEKKAWSLNQVGFESIGLAGVWNWQVKGSHSETGKRRLIPDLRKIDWNGRRVVIVFDTDEYSKTGVVQPAAELATVLSEHGAHVAVHWLPTGPRDPNTGLPSKMAIDDFLVAHGADAVRQQIQIATAEHVSIELDSYRDKLVRNRYAITQSGVYLDRSPTGAGKSTADVEFAAGHMDKKWLFVAPSHHQNDELVERLTDAGFFAAKFPQLTAKTCDNWSEAEFALKSGLAPTQSVCRVCKMRKLCTYQADLKDAAGADAAVATHKRCELTYDSMTKKRHYVAIQEQSMDILSPAITASGPFQPIADVAKALKDDFRLWQKHDAILYFDRMLELADQLEQAGQSGADQVIELPTDVPNLKNAQLRIYREIKSAKLTVDARSMQLVLAAMGGTVPTVSLTFLKSGSFYFTGVAKMQIKPRQTVILSDATADTEIVKQVCNRPVIDITPAEVLGNKHLVQQVDLDVKKTAKIERKLAILRTMLTLAESRLAVTEPRLGLITFKDFADYLAADHCSLEPRYRNLITKIGNFWGIDSRGSNDWHQDCDALIVLGTPRINQQGVRQAIQRFGLHQALQRDPRWTGDKESSGAWYWSGITESGTRRHVKSISYCDHDWRAAYNYAVSSELTQCIGRARANLENGIPCFVASNHEIAGIEIRITDERLQPISENAASVICLIDRGYTQQQVAEQLGIGLRTVQRVVADIRRIREI